MKSFKDNSKLSGNVIKILIEEHLFVTTAPYKPDKVHFGWQPALLSSTISYLTL